MSLRIAHIIASAAPAWGGPSRVIREMTAALTDLGHRVTVFSADAAPGFTRVPVERQAPFDPRVVHRCFRADLTRPPYPSIAMAAALARDLRGFDLAHVHGLFNAPCTTAMLQLRVLKLPFILRPCGMLDPWSMGQRQGPKALWWRVLDGPNARAASAIQCSTPHERSSVERLLGPSRAPRWPLIVECPQGVGHLPSAAGTVPPHPRPYLLFLGRIAEKKGLLPLIAALAEAELPDSPDLLVVGPDERGHTSSVKAAIANHQLEHRVHLVGPVFDATEKARYFQHARAFCLPSADENFGITLIEAARFGLPLLVSPDVGLAPAIAAANAGLAVAAEPRAIAAALTRLLGPEAAAFASGAHDLGNRFDWGERAAELVALYHRILAARGR